MKKVMTLLLLAFAMVGCEKMLVDDAEISDASDSDGNVVLRMNVAADQTRAGDMPLSDVCGRLNVAVFDADGNKVKTIAQSVSDVNFGNVGLSVAPGEYNVVAIAHNCNGSATITSTEKVTFPSNKVTDTFYYYGTLTATADRQEVAVGLHRAVAMLRLTLTGTSLRDDVTSLKFYYLGGSSTFSPAAGFGCVNSKQTEYRAWADDGTYELYTMPHDTEDVLTKVMVTALDAGDNEIGECQIENVPVTVNRVTNYTGDIFSGGGGALSVSITVDPTWDGEDYYNY